jgi:hypothetical protein
LWILPDICNAISSACNDCRNIIQQSFSTDVDFGVGNHYDHLKCSLDRKIFQSESAAIG